MHFLHISKVIFILRSAWSTVDLEFQLMMKRKKKKINLKIESTFTKNEKLLKRRFPEVWKQVKPSFESFHNNQRTESQDAGTDEKAAKAASLFYGNEDPSVAARKIVDGWNYAPFDTLFLIGIGLGCIPAEAVRKGVGNCRLILIEPSIQIFVNALECTDLKPLLTNDRVDLFVGDDVTITNIVERYQEKIPIGKNQIIVHPNYEKIVGDKIIVMKQELSERIRAIRDNWFTTKKHGRQMFTNAVANLPSLFAGTPMKNLRGKCKGHPAVCVAAGPSLDQAIPELKEIQTHVLLIACDSSVNALLKAGIRPHIVVTVDIFETNLEKLKPHFEELSETILIYSIESNPDNVRLFLGQKRVAVSAYNKLLLSWIDPAFNLQSQFPAMSSVSHMAIFSAMAVGADPIVMVGMDLSYSKGKSHSFDSAFFHSLEDKKLVPTHGNNGCLISSSPQFIADKLLIEKIVGQSSIRFINTSLNGAYVSGTEIKRLTEVADIESTSQLDADALLEAIDWKPAANEIAASTVIKNLNEKFVEFRQMCGNQKAKILAEIERIENHSQTNFDLERVAEYVTEFDAFQEENKVYTQMVKEIILSDLQEIIQRKEILSVGSDKKEQLKSMESLKLMAEHYEIFENGVDFQINQLKSYGNYANGVVALKQGFDSSLNDWDKHLSLARYFESHGEIWQARREYEACMERADNGITPYLELADSYMQAGLWKPAKEVFKKARNLINDAPEMSRLETGIENGIDALFDEMKKEWMQGNMHTTRKLLNQYLILRPDDPQANELKKVIRALDEEFSGDWAGREKEKAADQDMQIRYKQVVQHIKNKQFEQGVGILEGMTEDFPERSGVFREQVGDIRAMQKDYQSAIWNYRRVMKIDPLKIEINNKIDKIRLLQDR